MTPEPENPPQLLVATLCRENVPRKLRRLISDSISHRVLTSGNRKTPRIALTLPARVIPLCGDTIRFEDAFVTLTKDISNSGVSLVLNRRSDFEDAIVVLEGDSGEDVFFKGTVRQSAPLGYGFTQLGIELEGVVDAERYPELVLTARGLLAASST